MNPRIHLALVDDWELRGDGSGDVRTIQLEPLRQLLEIYEQHGLKASINAEVMQQLAHRRLADRHAQLGRLADQWDEAVLDLVRRGHDVQLHTHGQWSRSNFDGQKWHLFGDWDITHYSRDEASEVVASSRHYLEALVRRVDPSYSVSSYRAGSWAIAPSEHMMHVLIANGIAMDVSIVGGLRFANSKLAVDYSSVEEDFLPFYPVLEDARRVSDREERIVCFPTFSFSISLPFFVAMGATHVATRALKKAGFDATHLTRKPAHVALEKRLTQYSIWENERRTLVQRLWAKLRAENRHYIADLSQMSGMLWRRMLREIRRRAARSGHSVVPVVLENHTKDLGDLTNIRHLAQYLGAQSDIQVIRLRDMAANLAAGCYFVRMNRSE